MNKLLFIVFILPIFLKAQIPIAEFEFNENIEDSYENFEAFGEPVFNADKNALLFSKEYEILIDPAQDLSVIDLTTQISFRTKSSQIPYYGQYAIEGLLYKGGDTGEASRSMSIYISGASSPFNLVYIHSNAGQFESLLLKDVIDTDVLYNLHFVRTLDSVHVYNDCELLGKGPVSSSDINYNTNRLRLGMVPAPEGFLVWERTFNGEIHSLRFYDEALTAEQIRRSCLMSSTTAEESEIDDLEFSVFPNPSLGLYHLKCSSSGLYYRVTNVQGQIIMSGETAIDETVLDLTMYASGIYTLSLIDKSMQTTGKMLLKID